MNLQNKRKVASDALVTNDVTSGGVDLPDNVTLTSSLVEFDLPNSKKLKVDSTGVNVTGGITVDSLAATGTASVHSTLTLGAGGDGYAHINPLGEGMRFDGTSLIECTQIIAGPNFMNTGGTASVNGDTINCGSSFSNDGTYSGTSGAMNCGTQPITAGSINGLSTINSNGTNSISINTDSKTCMVYDTNQHVSIGVATVPDSTYLLYLNGDGLRINAPGTSSEPPRGVCLSLDGNNMGHIYPKNGDVNSGGYVAIAPGTSATPSEALIADDSGEVGISGMPVKGISLACNSTTGGFLLPNINGTGSVALASNGLLIYDTSAHVVQSYANGAWQTLQSFANASNYAKIFMRLGAAAQITSSSAYTLLWVFTNYESQGTAITPSQTTGSVARLTINSAGNYLVSFSLSVESGTLADTFTILLYKNGVACGDQYTPQITPSTSYYSPYSFTTVYNCVATDYFEIYLKSNSGTNLNLNNAVFMATLL